MKNTSKKFKKSLLVMVIASTTAIAAGGGVLAWFASSRAAEVQVMSLVLGGDTTEAGLKYCTLNKNGTNFNGYKSNDPRIVDESLFSYDSLFLDAGVSEKSSLEYAPGYSFTFSIEVTKGNPSMELDLAKYTAEISDSIRKTSGEGFSLAEALDIYTAVYSNKPTSEELNAYFLAQGVVGDDKFNLSSGTSESGLAVSIPLASDFNGESAYILMTLYFSDDPSTWYSLDFASDNASMVGNGTSTTIELPNTPKGIPSITISDSITATGSSKNITISASPYQIQSITLNDEEQVLGTDFTVTGNIISFYAIPDANDSIDITYVPYSSGWSIEDRLITFASAPLSGSLVNVSYNYGLETYVSDPVNGTSNVFEGLSILLNTLTIN